MLDDGPPGVDPEVPEPGSGEQDQGKPEDMVTQEGEDPSQPGGPEGIMRQREQEEVMILTKNHVKSLILRGHISF